MKMKKGARLLLFLLMLLFCVIIIIPFLIMFFTSLKTQAEISGAAFRLLPEHWLFSNYADAMKSSDWGRFFWNSFYTTFLAVIIAWLLTLWQDMHLHVWNLRERIFCFFLRLWV